MIPTEHRRWFYRVVWLFTLIAGPLYALIAYPSGPWGFPVPIIAVSTLIMALSEGND